MGSRLEIERNLLRDLMAAKDGIYVYRVPQRYKLSIKSVFKVIRKYGRYIEYHKGLIRIIGGKRDDLIKRYFPQKGEKASSESRLPIPSAYIGPQIEIDDLYCPKELRNQEEPAF